RPPGGSVVRIGVEAPSADDARRISAAVSPSLSAVLQGGQRTLPIEERLPGPIAQEMPGEPTEERVTC
ncbi:MAG: hypothetical protein U0Q22_12850, partial [Acidimicrobiales bacterium]